MSNVFDEYHNVRGWTGAAYNKTGTLSTATNITLTTIGWYSVSGSVDFCWDGPNTSTSAITSTTGRHQWAKETAVVRVHSTGMQLGIIRKGSTSGTYHVCLIKSF